MSGYGELIHRKMVERAHPYNGNDGIRTIASGMNYNMIDKIDIDIMELGKDGINHKNQIDKMIVSCNQDYEKRLKEAEKSPSLYQYLKNNIHN